MSKVKPQVGQVWNIGGHIDRDERSVIEIDSNDVWWSGSSYTPLADFFSEGFEFIPQNDLEWLAVNDVIAPSWAKFAYYSNHIDRTPKFSEIKFKDGKAQCEIQNMRYKLGLDKKPRISGKQWAQMLRDKNGGKA